MRRLLIAGTLSLALILSPMSAAWATILFAGGEDMDFKEVGTYALNTGGGYSSGYAREGLIAYNGGEPPGSYYLSPTFTASSVVWIHAHIYPSGYPGGANLDVMRVLSSDGVARIIVRTTAADGIYKISTGNAAGTITDLVTMSSVCFNSGSHNLDLYINYGTTGEVSLYCDGNILADYTGNVTTNSATQLNQFLFSSDCGGTYYSTNWSELIVATTDTRNMRLVTLAPSANGNTDTWDTGGVSNVNEMTLNTSTVNASGTSGEIQEYTVTSLPSGTFNVLDVWVNGYAQVGTTGPQHVQAMVRTGSTDYTSSNLSPPQGSWGSIYSDFPTNPYTGVAWTTSDLSAAGFNIGYKSAN